MTNRRPIPIASPSWRRTRAHSEWNVPRLDVAAGLADEADDPLAQLGRRAVGERDGEDLPRGDAVDADEVRDPVGEDPGLARSGAGEDQQRALGGRDGPCLLGVERLDDLLGPLLATRPRRAAGSAAGTGTAGSSPVTRRVAHPGGLLERRPGPRRGRRRPFRPHRTRSRRHRRAVGRRAGDDGWGSPPHCRSGGSPGSRCDAALAGLDLVGRRGRDRDRFVPARQDGIERDGVPVAGRDDDRHPGEVVREVLLDPQGRRRGSPR